MMGNKSTRTTQGALRLLVLLAISHGVLAGPTATQFDAALVDVKKEEMVFDASWETQQPALLRAQVFDNGSERSAYAAYLCMILGTHQITDATVNVVDVVDKAHAPLGSAHCRHLIR